MPRRNPSSQFVRFLARLANRETREIPELDELGLARIVNGQLWWDDMGDGLGVIEAASAIEGPWTPISGGPGTPIGTGGSMKFYRIAVPLTE